YQRRVPAHRVDAGGTRPAGGMGAVRQVDQKLFSHQAIATKTRKIVGAIRRAALPTQGGLFISRNGGGTGDLEAIHGATRIEALYQADDQRDSTAGGRTCDHTGPESHRPCNLWP